MPSTTPSAFINTTHTERCHLAANALPPAALLPSRFCRFDGDGERENAVADGALATARHPGETWFPKRRCVQMTQVARSILPNRRNLMHDPRISWFLTVVAVLMLVWIAEPGLSQVAPNQIADQSFRAQQLISKNQLLTPPKALKATARAREDLLSGRGESARKEIQRALDISPHCALALSLRGLVSYQDKDYPEASRAFQRSIEEDPTLGAGYEGLGAVLIIQRRFREALIPLDRAVALLPDSWFPHYQTALAHLGLGEALSGLKEIANGEHFPGNDAERRSGFAYLRALAYLQLKDSGAAKESLQQAVKCSPNGAYAPLAQKRLEQLSPSR